MAINTNSDTGNKTSACVHNKCTLTECTMSMTQRTDWCTLEKCAHARYKIGQSHEQKWIDEREKSRKKPKYSFTRWVKSKSREPLYGPYNMG